MIHDQGKASPLECRLPDGSRVVVVGLGGIGCALLQPLVLFLDSLRAAVRLVLVDGDQYEPENRARQAFGTLGNKAEVKAAEAAELLDASAVTVAAVPEFLTPENLGRLIKSGDLIFLCVDNHPTRRLVSEHCQKLSDVALFSGGNDGVDPPRQLGTYGNVQIAIRREGREVTAPITRFHPEIAEAAGPLPHELGCGQLAASAPQILFTNLAVASAMLGALFAFTCDQLTYREVTLDILQARMLPHT